MLDPLWVSCFAVPLFPVAAFAQAPEPSQTPTPDLSPRVEIGATVVGYSAVPDVRQSSSSFGARITRNISRRLAIQFDVRVPPDTIYDGLYGIRVRCAPDPEYVPWYLTIGCAGGFALHYTTHFDSPDGPGVAERSGGLGPPAAFTVGAGRRMTRNRRWNLSLEGELWGAGSGGVAVSAGVEVSFNAARGALNK